MKFTNSLRTSLYTTVAALLLTLSSFAQAPEKMSYQAVIRDASNALVTNQQVGMQISILQGETAVYEETQTPTSNSNGLVTLEIGTGTIVSGIFSSIDWSAGTYFIKTETDPTGVTNYTITGTSQLLSVPYALYANTSSDTEAVAANTAKVGYTEAAVSANTDVAANTAKVGITTDQASSITANTAKVGMPATPETGQMNYWNGGAWVTVVTASTSEGATLQLISGVPTWVGGTPSIGDTYGGGIVFYILQSGDAGYDADVQHGLIAATEDQSSGIQWFNNGRLISTGAIGTAVGTGAANTTAIISAQGETPTNYAAGLARAYTGGGYDDWFLPSKDELNLLYLQRVAVGGFSIGTTPSAPGGYYWSSTEYDNNTAWGQNFDNGDQYDNIKNNTNNVRAVRAF
jgi:hypothetical protein